MLNFLGVILDEYLTWKKHTQHIENKVLVFLLFIKQARLKYIKINIQNIPFLVFFAYFCQFYGKENLHSFKVVLTISHQLTKLQSFEWLNFILCLWGSIKVFPNKFTKNYEILFISWHTYCIIKTWLQLTKIAFITAEW